MPRTSRYIAMRPRADWDDMREITVGLTIHEPDPSPINTGLLDANGTPLYRVNDRQPIGFDLGGNMRPQG